MAHHSSSPENFVVLRNVKKYYPITEGLFGKKSGVVKAVDGVNLEIYRGETLGLVGESGCGKSTLGRLILRLEETSEGEIQYDGTNIKNLSRKDLTALRKKMQIIFQDPYSSLNPRQTIGRIIAEGLTIHHIGTPAERLKRVHYLMEVVGLRPEHINRYPHEFSGGQRQRIGIGRALALQPELIICDEPVSALDVSIQAQVINLLMDLQKDFGLTYLFISHDLSVVRHISDRVAVMYLGRIVESAGKDELYQNPCHPYTQALLSAAPIPDPDAKESLRKSGKRQGLIGDIPSPLAPPNGCHFHPRCPKMSEKCRVQVPVLKQLNSGHEVRCFLYS